MTDAPLSQLEEEQAGLQRIEARVQDLVQEVNHRTGLVNDLKEREADLDDRISIKTDELAGLDASIEEVKVQLDVLKAEKEAQRKENDLEAIAHSEKLAAESKVLDDRRTELEKDRQTVIESLEKLAADQTAADVRAAMLTEREEAVGIRESRVKSHEEQLMTDRRKLESDLQQLNVGRANLSEAEAAVEKRQKTANEIESKLFQRESALEAREKAITAKESEARDILVDAQSRAEAVRDTELALLNSLKSLDDREAMLNERARNLDHREEDLNTKELDLNLKEKQLLNDRKRLELEAA